MEFLEWGGKECPFKNLLIKHFCLQKKKRNTVNVLQTNEEKNIKTK